jgi:hypothetical protein
MISDNFVTGDHIYLRELQNFFFEVLGMMSITHYGAIGDGRFDNYGALQVAIDDANRRHLDYIYVPYGRYRYRGNLINIGNIKFVGNPHARIFNDREGVEIEILQFGVCTGRRNQMNVRELTADLLLTNGVAPMLEEGLYFTGNYEVSANGIVFIGPNELFYYDQDKMTLAACLVNLKYNNSRWNVGRNRMISDTLADDPMYIPSMQAVYEAIENINVGNQPTMMAYFESGITAPEGWSNEQYVIPMARKYSVGSAFTIQNDAIVVGANVSKIKASGLVRMLNESGGSRRVSLCLNGTALATASLSTDANTTSTYVIPDTVISVQQGDVIYLKTWLTEGDQIYASLEAGETSAYLTAEAIE